MIWVTRALAFVFWTALTQIGGAAYLLAQVIRWGRPSEPFIGLFFSLYLGMSLLAVYVAPVFGRVPLPCFESSSSPLVSASPLFCALNRHYVTAETREMLDSLSIAVATEHPGALTMTLDASFPFLDGFPLLPHLSHDDGEKVDLAFYYRGETGGYSRGASRSPLGYWAFEEPRAGDHLPCEGRQRWPSFRWDMRWLQPIMEQDLIVDAPRMRTALRWLETDGARFRFGKVFIEPHLADRFGVEPGSDVIRFQGCRAARHDDHLHIQLR